MGGRPGRAVTGAARVCSCLLRSLFPCSRTIQRRGWLTVELSRGQVWGDWLRGGRAHPSTEAFWRAGAAQFLSLSPPTPGQPARWQTKSIPSHRPPRSGPCHGGHHATPCGSPLAGAPRHWSRPAAWACWSVHSGSFLPQTSGSGSSLSRAASVSLAMTEAGAPHGAQGGGLSFH